MTFQKFEIEYKAVMFNDKYPTHTPNQATQFTLSIWQSKSIITRIHRIVSNTI